MQHILILGAGCAGTALARHLLALDAEVQVTLIEARRTFDREQRWCFWGPCDDAEIEALVSHRWTRSRVASPDETQVMKHPQRPYCHLHARDYFAHFHGQWRKSDRVNLMLGTEAGEMVSTHSGVSVQTSRGVVEGHAVVDATNPFVPPDGVGFIQSFAGAVIARGGASEEECCEATLMEFNGCHSDRVEFVYVLPFGNGTSLVEVTRFSRAAPVRGELDHLLLAETNRRFGEGAWETQAREEGQIPMTAHLLPVQLGPRRYAVGTAAGAARASSGYAFARIQRQARSLAGHLTRGTPVPRETERYSWLDSVLLRAMSLAPEKIPACFTTLFRRCDPSRLIRFLNDESSRGDDLAVITAMPKGLMLRAALSRSLRVRDGKTRPARRWAEA